MNKSEKTGGSSKPIVTERAPFVGYVNITLTDKDKADYDAWVLETDVVAESYLSALELGYQFTIKCDVQNEVFMCSVSQWDIAREDAGFIYTARSSEPNKALLKAIYVSTRKLAFNLSNGYLKRQNSDAF